MLARIAARPGWSALAGLALVGALAAGLGGLRMETDYRVFFDPGAPPVARFDAFQRRYGREDTLLIALERDGPVLSAEGLAALREAVSGVERLPHVVRVLSVLDYPLVEGRGGTVILEAPFVERGGALQPRLPPGALERRLVREPAVRGRLLSADGRMAAVVAMLDLGEAGRQARSEAVQAAAVALVERLRARHPSVRFHLTGTVPLDAAFAEANRRDLSTLHPLLVAAILGLAWLMAGSWRTAAAALAVSAGAVTGALGLAGWLALPLSPVSMAAPTIVVLLAVAHLMHLHAAPGDGDAPGRARRLAALRHMAAPAALATLTTVTGLLALLANDTPPFRHLGVIAAGGVALAYALVLLWGPLLLPHRPAGMPVVRLLEWLGRLMAPAARRWRAAAWLALAVCAALIPLNRFDDDYVRYFDESYAFRRDTEAVERRLAGIYTLEYDLAAPHGVEDPAYVRRVASLAAWIRSQPGVVAVESVDDVVRRVHRALWPDVAEDLPRERERIARSLVLYEAAVPMAFDLGSRIAPDRGASRLTVYVANLSIVALRDLDRRIAEMVRERGLAPAGDPHATGTSILFAHIGLRNIERMMWGWVPMFAVAALALALVLRRARWTAAAVAANLLPGIATLGLWGALDGKLGMGSASVLTLTLGLIVDDTIHLGWHFRRAVDRGLAAARAAAEAVRAAGPAILATSLMLAAGFGALGLSGFEVNAALGRMVALVVLWAVVVDLGLLPALLTGHGGAAVTGRGAEVEAGSSTREDDHVEADRSREAVSG